MNHIVRSVAVWIGLLAACVVVFAGIRVYAGGHGHPVDDAGAMLSGAIALWFGVQFGRASVKRLREWRAVGRADEVGRPQDGEFVVARGTLQCAAPLTTPFSGVPAAAYAYKAWRREKSGASTKNTWEIAYWWGEGSAPCTLFTRSGSLEVRSRLWLEAWSARVDNTERARSHFAAFLQGVQPTVQKAGIVVPGFEWDGPLDGPLRRDKMRQVDPPPVEALELHEWVVAPNEPVVLMGRYSTQRGGLVHDDRRGRPLRVLKGDVTEVQRQLRTGALAYGALSLAALAIAAVLAGSLLRWHDLTF
jgi:hypothetical protein